MKKVIARIKGGLGNQLFCYAAARRLALVNDAELAIDDVTGFARDCEYRSQYMLDRFNIPVRKATPGERLEPFERHRRAVMKWLSMGRPFLKRPYIEQEGTDFDARLLDYRFDIGTVYLDGLWQSENYFKDIEKVIRRDLRITAPEDDANRRMAENISRCDAVAVHVRFFDDPDEAGSLYNLREGYYRRAIEKIRGSIKNPHFFLFSDNIDAALGVVKLRENEITSVDCNKEKERAYADLWLMSQCRHFIIANSTFSWWGAWLSAEKNKVVIAPDIKVSGKTAWGFEGLIPPKCLKV